MTTEYELETGQEPRAPGPAGPPVPRTTRNEWQDLKDTAGGVGVMAAFCAVVLLFVVAAQWLAATFGFPAVALAVAVVACAVPAVFKVTLPESNRRQTAAILFVLGVLLAAVTVYSSPAPEHGCYSMGRAEFCD